MLTVGRTTVVSSSKLCELSLAWLSDSVLASCLSTGSSDSCLIGDGTTRSVLPLAAVSSLVCSEPEPVEDFRSRFRRSTEGEIGEGDSPLSELTDLLSDNWSGISVKPLTFNVSAVWKAVDSEFEFLGGWPLKDWHLTFQDNYLQNCRQLVLGNVDFAVIHKIDHRLQIGEFDVLQNDDRMLTRIAREQRLEFGQ